MNKVTISLRSFARRLGITRWIGLAAYRQNYEEKFNQALLGFIRSGDVVWDVGANVGHYTGLFLDRSGADGKVIAVEPSPACTALLREKFKSFDNVLLIEAALSGSSGTMSFDMSSGEHSPTNHLSESSAKTSASVQVRVMTGDQLAAETAYPNVVKIDVEGFEKDVLVGMPAVLKHPALRGIFCEIHFRILEERGLKNAPLEIERILKAAGYQIVWIDPSHLLASKGDA